MRSLRNKRACAPSASAVIASAIAPGRRTSSALTVSPRSARIMTVCCAMAGTYSCHAASRTGRNNGTTGAKLTSIVR